MATSVISLLNTPEKQKVQRHRRQDRTFALGLVSALTIAAFGIHGYHPFVEDGGLYVAGIKRVLNPSLYPYGTEFVLGHLRFSLFAPAVAAMVRLTGLRLETVLLGIYLITIWLTLAAGWMLACRCFAGRNERTGAVALLAVWLTMPIAGTSLMLMDPYVTARSISTPCTLLALVGALDFVSAVKEGERWRWSSLALVVVSLAVAVAVHPLMAAYGFCCVLALGSTIPEGRGTQAGTVIALYAAALVVAAVLHTAAQPESEAYHQVALSRSYWFLSQWHWYEVVGLAAPLMILAFIWRQNRFERNGIATLAQMGTSIGGASFLVAAVFARIDSTTHLVARLQPLRVFQQVYIVMILLLGAAVARWLGKRPVGWSLVFGALAGVMFLAERQTFPASAHIELGALPGTRIENQWVEAFDWIRRNTPSDAVFALDADFITRPGEDAQGFRAIAERSMLPDYSKDGGEAAITPSLTAAWTAGQNAQKDLSEHGDAQRIEALERMGVNWVVLQRSARTALACDYANTAVKVCRLPTMEQADGVGFSFRSQPTLQQLPAGTQ